MFLRFTPRSPGAMVEFVSGVPGGMLHLTKFIEIVDTGCTDPEMRTVKGVRKRNAESAESLGTLGSDYPTLSMVLQKGEGADINGCAESGVLSNRVQGQSS